MTATKELVEILLLPATQYALRAKIRATRWNLDELTDEIALRVLEVKTLPEGGIQNPVGYLITIAQRVIRSIDPLTLQSKTKKEMELLAAEEQAVRPKGNSRLEVNNDAIELLQIVKEHASPELTMFIKNGLDQIQEQHSSRERGSQRLRSPTQAVARCFGISLPTVRKRIRRETKSLIAKFANPSCSSN